MIDTKFKLPTPVTITNIEEDNYRTKTFTLRATLEDATPGQFVMAWLPGFDEKPFSLVNNDPVTLMVTNVGPFSELIHEKQIGDQVWLRGPYGHGFKHDYGADHAILVGGGYGVAPLLWLARIASMKYLEYGPMVIGARTGDDILYANHFRALGQQGYFPTPIASANGSEPIDLDQFVSTSTGVVPLYIVTEDGSLGFRGQVTDVVRALLEKYNVGDHRNIWRTKIERIYGCGPDGMLHALKAIGEEYNVVCELSWEAYMRCGIGICGSCEHEGKLLCIDGPVLSTAKPRKSRWDDDDFW
ncbi:MAG: hypothetical protein AAF639_21265 [Chloroflexota bacterium]